jgi:ABC-type Fe3+/spermidine/putrescine transport system ATPase subunit
MPRQLSGGQQQRVALARALAIRPDVLLLDEPLGALDAKIRLELRRTLRAIQRELGITTILVTHDQEEAFELADRLGVMSFGRLLEVGKPEQLYQHPQTEFVATFLGTANLLVGRSAGQNVQLGPVSIPLASRSFETSADSAVQVMPAKEEPRVQVLFRPEHVALAADVSQLAAPELGQGKVEQIVFSGSFERLRLRLPPLPGVRPIAPPVAFGDDTILVEATRQQDEMERLPLQPGDSVWVGVRQIHALAHPGLQFLILTDDSPKAQAALALGGQLTRLAQARAVVLGCGLAGEARQSHLQRAKEIMGSGLAALDARATGDPPALAVARETERQPCDLVIMGFSGRDDLELAEQVLQAGEHHLLLVQRPHTVPSNALICVTTGEPGKDDVLFAARLVRHMGAQATLMSVLDDHGDADPALQDRAERFLAGGVRSLEILGVPARAILRSGAVARTITQELATGEYDLLTLGAPLADRDGKISLKGIVGQVLSDSSAPATLIVRSDLTALQEPPPAEMVRV